MPSELPIWPYAINPHSWQARGLVGCWAAWEPCANRVWSDMSGRGNTGTVIVEGGDTAYTPTIQPGAFRRGLRFVGAASSKCGHVSLARVFDTLPLSVAVWFRPENTNTNNQLFWTGASAGWNSHYLIAGSGGTLSAATAQNTTFAVSSGIAYVANQWQHGVGIWSAANYRQAYLNGIPDTADTTSKIPASFAASYIGAGAASVNVGITGAIAEVRVYNRVLSGAEVMALYAPQSRWDLYQAARRWYYVPAGPAFLAAWAAHSNSQVGTGVN